MTIATGNSYLDSLGASAAAAATQTAASKGTIDQSGFLKLLTTQLRPRRPTTARWPRSSRNSPASPASPS